ncbi:PIR Superfamily Protein [Plasmodium ovale wallikeri]|uniref:PIR Superfamily Protein n=2 Tax=Plasmodium ovale TaxID=36330 RepID=A0A1A9AKN8_PLAOA|nr:PIR Superfamily Protein [Plasmodium ovale wallikeri]SBT58085.1 PIR Superfamily Protein [Plasmodium ovale wallikeri]SBT74600.1 PIR protein [Plasmodium ovale]
MGDDYDNIPNSPAIRYYNMLDDKFIGHNKHTDCSQFYSILVNDLDAYKLCMSFLGNLENYDKLDFSMKHNVHKCHYLNLWAYDRLSKIKGIDKTTIMSSLLTHWGKYKYKDECTGAKFVYYRMNNADYMKTKRIYDYALNYDQFELLYKKNNNIPCTKKHDEYIRKILSLIEEVRTECEHEKGFKHYCDAWEDIQKIYSKDELLNLECKSVEEESASPREDIEGPKSWQDEDISGLQQRLKREEHQGEVAKEPIPGLPLPEVGSSSGSHQVAATAVPILGISSIFFLLYKFTGLGSVARNLLRTKGINGINSQEELTNELLENTYDDNAYPDITETYIGYQAT